MSKKMNKFSVILSLILLVSCQNNRPQGKIPTQPETTETSSLVVTNTPIDVPPTALPTITAMHPSTATERSTSSFEPRFLLFLVDRSPSVFSDNNCPENAYMIKNLPYFFFSLSTLLADNELALPEELFLGMAGFGGSNIHLAYPMIPMQSLSEHDQVEWISWPEPPRATPLPTPTHLSPIEDFPKAFEFAIDQLRDLQQPYPKHLIIMTDGIVKQLADFDEIAITLDEDILGQNNIEVHIVTTCSAQRSIAWVGSDFRHNDFVQVYPGGEQYPTDWSPKDLSHLVKTLTDQIFDSLLPDQNAGWLTEDEEIHIPGTAREFHVAVVSLAQKENVDFTRTPRPFILLPSDRQLEIKNLNNLWEYSLVGDQGLQPLARCNPRTWFLRSNLNFPSYYLYNQAPPKFSQSASSFSIIDNEGRKIENPYLLYGSTDPKLQVSTTISIDGFSDADFMTFDDCYSMTLSVVDEENQLLYRDQISNIEQEYLWSVVLDNMTMGQVVTFIQEVSTIEDGVVFSTDDSIVVEFVPVLDIEITYSCPTTTCFISDDSSQDSFKLNIQTDWRGEITRPVVSFISTNGGSSDCSGDIMFEGDGNSHFKYDHSFDSSGFSSNYTLNVLRHTPVAPNIFALFMNKCGNFLVEWPDLDLPEFLCEFPEPEYVPDSPEYSANLNCSPVRNQEE